MRREEERCCLCQQRTAAHTEKKRQNRRVAPSSWFHIVPPTALEKPLCLSPLGVAAERSRVSTPPASGPVGHHLSHIAPMTGGAAGTSNQPPSASSHSLPLAPLLRDRSTRVAQAKSRRHEHPFAQLAPHSLHVHIHTDGSARGKRWARVTAPSRHAALHETQTHTQLTRSSRTKYGTR